MTKSRLATTLTLLLLLAATGYGWWSSSPSGVADRPAATGAAPGSTSLLVDRRPLDDANRLLALADTAPERDLADQAVTTADHLLDLNFAAALREATEHPAPLTPAAREAQARLEQTAAQLVTDNLQIQRLTALAATAKGDQAGTAAGELALAQVQFEIDQDEFNQAGKDLMAAGGDLRGRIQSLVAEHQAVKPKAAPRVDAAPPGPGLLQLVPHWLAQRKTDQALAAARTAVNDDGERLNAQRIAIRERLMAAGPGAASPAAPPAATSALDSARRVSADHRQLASLDERHSALKDLAGRYTDWRELSTRDTRHTLHAMLLGVIAILAACLVLLFIDGWLSVGFARLPLDRRQLQTLRTVTSVGLQVLAVVFIALMLLGPPTQLSTFLGLAGAGLTVALKDFIVAFIGWVVLMGKNGIRLGDWVEIDGVAGEVVELGIFHTVLLETGNWTDSGHPTGRRVTFTNSFAIQGHYFNFSTTGQWLWDELQLSVPLGQDLEAVVSGITRIVTDLTAADAGLAEAEWRRTVPGRRAASVSALPVVSVKPVPGATQVSLRYIARANDRYRLRDALYQAAVTLLARRDRPPAEPGPPVATPST